MNEAHKDEIQVSKELSSDLTVGPPIWFLKQLSKAAPALFAYKSLIYWVPRVIVAGILSYAAIHLLRAGLLRFGVSIP